MNIMHRTTNSEVAITFLLTAKPSQLFFRIKDALDCNSLGPTGFDRMSGYVYKHAGAWDARLDHYSQNSIGESNYAMAA